MLSIILRYEKQKQKRLIKIRIINKLQRRKCPCECQKLNKPFSCLMFYVVKISEDQCL